MTLSPIQLGALLIWAATRPALGETGINQTHTPIPGPLPSSVASSVANSMTSPTTGVTGKEATPSPTPTLEKIQLDPLNWEKTGGSDGIETFKRDIPGSDIIAMRGQGIIDAPIGRVAQVIFDIPRSPEW